MRTATSVLKLALPQFSVSRIRRYAALTAIPLLLAVAAGCGSDKSSSPPNNSSMAPAIASFAPTSGTTGTAVTISGSHFTGATAVSFNGKAATYTISSDGQIATSVPSGATTGKIAVTTPNGTASSSASFTINVTPPPGVTSFNPASGDVGNSITITGTNFTGATSVKFNGTAATFTLNSGTQITATVPPNATTGKISVTTGAGTGMSPSSFTVNSSSSSLDLTIDGLYVTQATQNYPSPAVPMVANRSAWVRVFVVANQSNTAQPQVRVKFVNGSTTNTLTINAPSSSVPTSVDIDNSSASWNAAVNAAWIQPGTQVIADVDPSGLIAESNESNNQFTENLDVHTLKQWKISLISIRTGDGRVGTVEDANRDRFKTVDFAKRIWPVPDTIDVAVGTPMTSSVTSVSSNGTGWDTVLGELQAKRVADGATDRYYYGLLKTSYSSGVVGLGYIGYPAAIGWDVDSSAPSVLAHEVGHNFNRPHSPCGGAGGADPNYPYAGGLIGVPGWDVFASSGNFKSEATYTDIMGYCSPQWVSDYVYDSVLNFRESSPLGDVSADKNSSGEGLLVWGRIDGDQITLEPAFRVSAVNEAPKAGPYTWEARDAVGRVLASMPFDAPQIADLPDATPRTFAFVVPMSADAITALQTIRLMKGSQEIARQTRQLTAQPDVSIQDLPNHAAQISWDAQLAPVLMLRDAKTRQVVGFLRGGSAVIEDAPQTLEIHFSEDASGKIARHQRTN